LSGEISHPLVEGLFRRVVAAVVRRGVDSSQFFYTTLDEAHRPDKAFRHKVGTDAKTDECLFTEDDELFWLGETARYCCLVCVAPHAVPSLYFHRPEQERERTLPVRAQRRQSDERRALPGPLGPVRQAHAHSEARAQRALQSLCVQFDANVRLACSDSLVLSAHVRTGGQDYFWITTNGGIVKRAVLRLTSLAVRSEGQALNFKLVSAPITAYGWLSCLIACRSTSVDCSPGKEAWKEVLAYDSEVRY
jgi:hypothetical protein